MQVVFHAQERTLREIVALALSAGWKVVRVTRSPGSLFGYIIAVPVPVPMQRRARAGSGSMMLDAVGFTESSGPVGPGMGEREAVGGSRSGTPTFGSRVDLPSFEEAFARFGGVRGKTRVAMGGEALCDAKSITKRTGPSEKPQALKPAFPLKKKIPSPLSIRAPTKQIPTVPLSPAPSQSHSPHSPQSFGQQQPPTRPPHQFQPSLPPSPQFARPFHSPTSRQSFRQPKQQPLLETPPKIKSPAQELRTPPHAHVSPERSRPTHISSLSSSLTPPPPPSLLPTPRSPASPVPSRRVPVLSRKLSYAALSPHSQGSNDGEPRMRLRRTGSVVGLGVGGGIGMGSLFALAKDHERDRDPYESASAEVNESANGSIGEGTVLAAAAKIELGMRSRAGFPTP